MTAKGHSERSIRQQLFAYSLSAGATLATVGVAKASIVYSGPENLITTATFTVEGSGTTTGTDQDLSFAGSPQTLRFFGFGGSYLSGTSYGVQYVIGSGAQDGFRLVRAAANYSIGPSGAAFQTSYGGNPLFRNDKATPVSSPVLSGPFQPGGVAGRGFLPIRLDAGGGNFHYGWVDYQPSADGLSATIFGHAYETGNNVPILAGAVPEPAESAFALGVLALGAAGLHRLRKQRLASMQA